MSVTTLNDSNVEVLGATLDLYANATALVYSLEPQYEKEFVEEFYPNTVVPWLKANGMQEGKGWIINHQLIYTSDPPYPWNGIPHVEQYLSKEHPPVPQELPGTDDSGETYPTAQAS